MAKYRIIRREHGSAELYGGEQYWQQMEEDLSADLDLDEIRELNRLSELPPPPPRGSSIFSGILSVLLIAAFIFWVCMDLAPFMRMPDLSFLSRSAELAKDEALASLKTAVVSIEGAYGSGSGFNLRADGLIVTNRHVVEDNLATTVIFADGSRFLARNWQYVEGYDLAVAAIRGENLPHVQLSAELPQSGDDLIFIGNPLGFDWTISEAQMLQTLSSGEDSILYFSGPVRSGSSGSPLFNAQGQVVGVIFGSLRDVKDTGLAIPGSLLLSYVDGADTY